MRVSRQKITLLILLIFFAAPIAAFAAGDDEPDDYDVKDRVVRISLITGEVNIKRNGTHDWEPARLNFPLLEGDIVATTRDSNLEIQVDARNFVRLAANSVVRIVTLRDEGIAISIFEGTVMVRLAKFDRAREYFEIDALKSTLAAEKTGIYRVDAPREGRIRLTVRDGGSARIYSDTSGFSLRDGRSAELVASGENAGDWELIAAAAPDAIDKWLSERESYLAQRLKYDVKYFDEYVWGAEDLEAYGDWNYTNDFGWIWYPRASFLSSYTDWAPYRYGHWTWCPPYGWTWVGYEPWGWAPYHYGRWVYHNNAWAWSPRSQYYRDRSWWRPALVAFDVNFNSGNDICWYPLSYHDRDPRSRRYRHEDRGRPSGYARSGNDGDGRRGEGRHDGYPRNWRGVTHVARRDFGNPERRGQPVEEPVARRVVDRSPERGVNLPGRGSWGRIPVVTVSEGPTGATERRPGVALDDDLRRSRVFRGREPREAREPRARDARDARQPGAATTSTTTTTQPAATETQPTGAVARPEPRPRRESRLDAPAGGEERRSGDWRGRSEREGRRRDSTGNAPATTPGTQSSTEQAAPVSEPPRETRRENPRVERRERDAPINRTESQPESRPERRSESRSDSPRSESPRPQRSESPRSERHESPRSESPRSESPRSERHESPRSESPRSESPRSEPSRSESPRSESPRSEAPRSEPSRSESPRSESPRSEAPRPAPDRPTPDKPSPVQL